MPQINTIILDLDKSVFKHTVQILMPPPVLRKKL